MSLMLRIFGKIVIESKCYLEKEKLKMQKSILIHNPQCSKSRRAKDILEERGIEFDTVDYLRDGLKEKLLLHLPELLSVNYEQIIRVNEEIYKELKLSDKKLSDNQWIVLLMKYPILIQRPIFINGDVGIIARPPEVVLKII